MRRGWSGSTNRLLCRERLFSLGKICPRCRRILWVQNFQLCLCLLRWSHPFIRVTLPSHQRLTLIPDAWWSCSHDWHCTQQSWQSGSGRGPQPQVLCDRRKRWIAGTIGDEWLWTLETFWLMHACSQLYTHRLQCLISFCTSSRTLKRSW